MLKVLQVNKLYPPDSGGIEVTVKRIAEGLQGRVDMRVLVCNSKRKTQEEIMDNIPVMRVKSYKNILSMPISPAFPVWFKRMASDRDIIHFHMPFPLGDIAYLLSGFQSKVVVTWHSDIVRQKSLSWLYTPFMRNILNRAAVIMVGSPGVLSGSDVLQKYRDKCAVVPFGMDIDGYMQASESMGCPYDSSSENIRVAFIGRLVYYKGVSVLLHALSKVPQVELFLIGDGPQKMELQALTEELHISHRTHFLGSVSNELASAYLRDCDFFVLPSVVKSEAFGLVQLEAMAFGKPVINTRLNSGVPDVSIHGQTGLTVEPNNIEELAEAMRRLAEDASLRARLGANAYARVRAEYSLQQMLDGVYKQYELCVK